MTEVRKKRTKMEVASQIAIFAGAASIFLVGSGSPWGFVLGICQQPFWYYTSISHRQWGLTAASVVYTGAWVNGIYHNWGELTAFF